MQERLKRINDWDYAHLLPGAWRPLLDRDTGVAPAVLPDEHLEQRGHKNDPVLLHISYQEIQDQTRTLAKTC